jgi:tyrosine-specific transport protein
MKTLGAIFIVAGTAIGGGMIAMPIASASVGFGYSSLIMIAIWAFMFLTSLITLEMNMPFKKGVSISYAAQRYLGKGGGIVSGVTIAFLFYALLAAYMTGGSSILCQIFSIQEYHALVLVILTFIFGGVICAQIKTVDIVNRFLVFVMIAFFLILIWNLIPHVQIPFLQYQTSNLSSHLPLMIPLFFTSFGFHGSIPTIINYIGPDRKKLRFIFFVGSVIPLIVYIIWEMVSLGVLSNEQFLNIKNAGIFTGAMSTIIKWPYFPSIVQSFSFLAVFTSFLGVGIGLFDFIEEHIKTSSRMITGLLTFTPPLLFALFYPEGFIIALCYAAIALSILAVIIPSVVVLKIKTWKMYQKIGLIAVFFVGIAIIIIDLFHINGEIK